MKLLWIRREIRQIRKEVPAAARRRNLQMAQAVTVRRLELLLAASILILLGGLLAAALYRR